ncbi:hypothetical protein Cgig2_008804 [Carnegiea gigantea]|uniref:Endonuclease/exonuclease/phosphatase n=1 Tax=Carnegiea gigantea TaxID=171969 RepID=A0A9Q1GZN2_9CARY|nr:hypothetical protein Cgig2_008804 [Carnegiea gigantea]
MNGFLSNVFFVECMDIREMFAKRRMVPGRDRGHAPNISHAEDNQNASNFTKVIRGAPAEKKGSNKAIIPIIFFPPPPSMDNVTNKVGLIGLLETKVKEKNVKKVATHVFPGWRWMHNFSLNPKGRIWMELIHMTEQYTHCYAIQMSSNVKFYITFIYGLNQVQLRKKMWTNLSSSQPIHEPWCIIGDFNSILYKEDRIGGGDVLLTDV